MIYGIGVDIVENARFNAFFDKPIMKKLFSPKEIALLNLKGVNRSLSIAAHFAAKEAFAKAVGGFSSFSPRDVQIFHLKNGQPYLSLKQPAYNSLNHLDNPSLSLSLSHENLFSVAFVIISKES